MPVKRKDPEGEGQEEKQLKENEPAQVVVVVAGVSSSAASLRAVRKPFKVQCGCRQGTAAADRLAACTESCPLPTALLPAAERKRCP
jgi:hypothetical protein